MEFFSSGSILKQINHTVIPLVPKSGHTPHVGDFRPISCCNVTYKVIAKILASRLRPILGNIVDHAQATFVEGRSMVENIHLAQELMRQYNRKRVAPRCFLKIDLTKAYDSVSWDFLRDVLEGPLEICKLDHGMYYFSNIFHCFEWEYAWVLQRKERPPARMLKVTTNDIDFNYHPKCGPLKITHLAFADDLMLFARGDVMLNILKSSLFTTGIHGELLEDILQLTHVLRDRMPFRYLGIPLASGKLKVELIRAVLQRVECFWLFIFPISATITSMIVSYCWKFLWGSKKPLVAWKDLCLPKDEGGIGLKDLKSWNLELLAKSLWNTQHKKDTLWIRWFLAQDREQVQRNLDNFLSQSNAQNWVPNLGENSERRHEILFSFTELSAAQNGDRHLGFMDSFFSGGNMY
ncbi:uncharacterized protein LOC111371725 [Olea europaea var. sylvestris]|uniref:uncharacterized protein LOC111371725 n=1 Tax=Olea europaea var. sylvestris TaxID=158386 RepID=UPI000C1D31E0|nr:uncharacterized protein LOC111371725 [Olea europaea var. sylvestris]